MTRSFKTIIVGASFRGCGLAARQADTLILESTVQIGTDFVYTFNPGTQWGCELKHPATQEFRHMLTVQSVLCDSRLQVGGLAAITASWCLKHDIKIEFLSRVIRREQHVLTVMSPAGIDEVYADRIIDASPVPGAEKYVTALLSCPDQSRTLTVEVTNYSEFTIHASPCRGEAYLRLKLPGDCGWPEARARLHTAWRQRDDSLRQWRLVLIGTRFDYAVFANPALALDCGLNEALT